MQFPITKKLPNLNKQELFQKINDLKTCPLKNAGIKVVYPIGDGSSGVMLIGEAPGAKEDEVGEPFVGASGKFLNNTLLPSVDLTRENIYLTNIVKCRPPLNRDPSEQEKLAWSEILLMEILTVKPKIIGCLGRHSLSFFMPEAKISEVHGKVFEIEILKGLKQKILPLYHPAVALYNPGMRPKLIADFEVLREHKN